MYPKKVLLVLLGKHVIFLTKNSTKHLKNSSKKLKNSQKLIEVQKSLPYGNSCLNNVMSVIAG